jgi:hypothetical protein
MKHWHKTGEMIPQKKILTKAQIIDGRPYWPILEYKMKTKSFIALFLILMATLQTASAEQMLRFWRGYKIPTLSDESFINGLNQIFIPMTANLGQSKTSMQGYLPVITPLLPQLDIADEFALVVYGSGDKYLEFRNTDEGKNYSNAHWDYFSREKSKSAVVKKYVKNSLLELGNAYAFTDYQGAWDVGYSRFMIVERNKNISDEEYLKNAGRWLYYENNEGDGHLAHVALIEKDYIAVYDLWTDEESFSVRNDNNMDNYDDIESYYLTATNIGKLILDIALPKTNPILKRGEGLTAQIAK